MTKPYLLLFNARVGSRDEVHKFLDEIPQVTYWYSCMPHCIFLTSDLSANDLAQRVRSRFGQVGDQRYLVVEVRGERQGWLPKNVWHMFSNPEHPRLNSD